MVDRSSLEDEETFEDRESELSEDQKRLVQEWTCPECGGLRAKKKAMKRADLDDFKQCTC